MSYLMKFDRRADKVHKNVAGTIANPENLANPVFHVQWRSISGLVEVNPRAPQNVVIFYRRYSRLGELFAKNHEQECYYVAQAVRKALDMPADTTFSYMAY